MFQANLSVGLVNIAVTDKKFPTNMATTMINVVEPFRIHLELADITQRYKKLDDKGVGANSFQNQLQVKEWDDGQWILVEQSIYLIKAFVYDENGEKITLTSNVEISNEVDEKYLTVLHKNSIGSELVVQVKKQKDLSKAQKTIFSSTLTAINSSLGAKLRYKPDKNKLKQQKEILVTGPVRIVHPTDLILLPQIQS